MHRLGHDVKIPTLPGPSAVIVSVEPPEARDNFRTGEFSFWTGPWLLEADVDVGLVGNLPRTITVLVDTHAGAVAHHTCHPDVDLELPPAWAAHLHDAFHQEAQARPHPRDTQQSSRRTRSTWLVNRAWSSFRAIRPFTARLFRTHDG